MYKKKRQVTCPKNIEMTNAGVFLYSFNLGKIITWEILTIEFYSQ